MAALGGLLVPPKMLQILGFAGLLRWSGEHLQNCRKQIRADTGLVHTADRSRRERRGQQLRDIMLADDQNFAVRNLLP